MPGSAADLLFTGGPIRTMDPGHAVASALAVRDGRIAAVGDREVHDLAGPKTEVVDLRGRVLLPGFQDAHIHAVTGGVELGECDLSAVTDVNEYLRLVRSYARSHPDRDWITGSGWSMECFDGGLPTRELLDSVVPDRPVFLLNRDHHGAWVNSLALDRAGITATTPDPPDGRIERGPDGAAIGMLQEGAAELVAELVPARTEADLLDGLLRAQSMLHGYGITAWQDAWMSGGSGFADNSTAYLRAARDGVLTASVIGALWWSRDSGLEQLPELLHRRESWSTGNLSCTTVKIMVDGIAENFTAAMTSPYLDSCGCATGNSGHSFIEPEALRDYVTAVDAEDFQVHFHALGDRAVREALDAVEAARTRNGVRDTRPHLAHLQVVRPEDIARFPRLGASANIQPLWAAHEPQMDELTIPFLGPDRARLQYPFGDLLRAGAHLAAGSDWPVSSADPMQGIHVAVNRVLHGCEAPVFLPEQRLELGVALAAYTSGAAYVNHRDDSGRLRTGYTADLVVLDRDPFDGPAEAIGDTHAALTYVAGARVHAAPDA
ncbi:amidohydrolase [Pseudonocardia spinosispora]|uniref:amidohydrolase n=1 Tax=Pseudonocardia spinosispora TaxID=103441 RepID=UPI000423CB70|nr:amidohydrolase [Pseudonocardia spinosispora]